MNRNIHNKILDPAFIAAQQAYDAALFDIGTCVKGGIRRLGIAELRRHPLRGQFNAMAAQKGRWERGRHLLVSDASFAAWNNLDLNDHKTVQTLDQNFQRLVDLKRSVGEKADPNHPLSVLIANQTPGLLANLVENIREEMGIITNRLSPAITPRLSTIQITLNPEQKKELALALLRDIGLDFDRINIRWNAKHPFCLGNQEKVFLAFAVDREIDFSYFMMEVVHEGMHALLRQNSQVMINAAIDETFAMLGDHALGRTAFFAEDIVEKLHEIGIEITPEELYADFTRAKVRKTRLGLDPLQYAQGIALLYEMERDLILGLDVADLHGVWPREFEKKFGRPPSGDWTESHYQDMQPFSGEAYLRSASYLVAQPAAFQLYATMSAQCAENWASYNEFLVNAAREAHGHDFEDFIREATGKPLDLCAFDHFVRSLYRVPDRPQPHHAASSFLADGPI